MNECDAASRIAKRANVPVMTLVPLQQQTVYDVFLSALEALLAHLMCSRDDKLIPHFYSFKSWSEDYLN